MHIDAFIGLRFLGSPRQDRAVSIVTWISMLGVMLGVTALIVTVSVMNGFRENLVLAVTGTNAHMTITRPRGQVPPADLADLTTRLAALPGVVATAPYLSRQAFVEYGGSYRAILLRGIDPVREHAVTDLGRFLMGEGGPAEGDQALARIVAALGDAAPGEREGMVLGRDLATALGVSTGDTVRVVSTVQRPTPIGPVPLMKTFRVTAVFMTGIAGADDLLAYANEDIVRRLYRLRGADGLAVRTQDPERIPEAEFAAALPGYDVAAWSSQNRNIFHVMRLEKLGIFLILSLIIVVGFFNIISSLVMLVLEKRKAVAILKSLGATDGMVRRIFFMQGTWIGAVGTLAGLSLGLLVCWVLATFDIIRLPPGVFPLVTRLPLRIELADLALITGSSFAICMLVTLYPASRAARVDPVENLRYE